MLSYSVIGTGAIGGYYGGRLAWAGRTDAMVPYSPSMKLGYDHHRPMELYYLYTRPIEEAKKVGFEMPKLAMLEAELRFKAQCLDT